MNIDRLCRAFQEEMIARTAHRQPAHDPMRAAYCASQAGFWLGRAQFAREQGFMLTTRNSLRYAIVYWRETREAMLAPLPARAAV